MKKLQPLDRKIETFRFKIQQTLNLEDEKIQRLVDTLNEYKVLIAEQNEKLQRLDNKIINTKEEINSMKRQIRSEFEARLSLISAQHHQIIQNIQERQNEEMNSLQESFQYKLERFTKFSNDQIVEQQESIQNEINKTKNELGELRHRLYEIEDENESINTSYVEQCLDIHHGVINEMQNIVKERNEERKQNLVSSRNKLKECLDMIDEQEKEHQATVSDLRTRLNDIDENYEIASASLSRSHQEMMKKLKSLLAEANQRNQQMQSTVRRLKTKYVAEMQNSVFKVDQLRHTTRIPLQETNRQYFTPEVNKIRKKKDKLSQAHKTYILKERQLAEVKKENDSLIREKKRLQFLVKHPPIRSF